MTETQAQKLTEIQTLKARALTFPRALYDARQRAADCSRRVKDLKAEIADAELEATLNASLAKDAVTGKPLHTNAAMRDAAAAKELAASPAHRDRLRALAAAEGDALTAQLEVSRIEDEHRGFRSLVELTLAEISLLVAGR